MRARSARQQRSAIGQMSLFRYSWISSVGLFGDLLETRKRLAPETIELVAKGFDARGIELVDAPRAGRPLENQSRGLQDFQVLGDRGAADGQLRGELSDRARAIREALEDCAARCVAQGGPWIGVVSHD